MRPIILLVDDNRSVRQYCKQELESEGYHVVVAHDGEDALELMAGLAADVVVMDEHMPHSSGRDVARAIGKRDRPVPVVLFTGDPNLECYRSDTVRAVVAKSADLSSLKSIIRQLTGEGAAKRECTEPMWRVESLK
jgi:two-component system response regulator PilR (NtrC family)